MSRTALGFMRSDFSPIWEQLSDRGEINGASHCRPTYVGCRWSAASGDGTSEIDGRCVERRATKVIERRRDVASVAGGSLVAQWNGHNNHPLLARRGLQRAPKFSPGGFVMKALFTRFVREESGQDLIEYALLVGFVSLVAAAGATLVGTSLNNWYTALAGVIDTMPPALP